MHRTASHSTALHCTGSRREVEATDVPGRGKPQVLRWTVQHDGDRSGNQALQLIEAVPRTVRCSLARAETGIQCNTTQPDWTSGNLAPCMLCSKPASMPSDPRAANRPNATIARGRFRSHPCNTLFPFLAPGIAQGPVKPLHHAEMLMLMPTPTHSRDSSPAAGGRISHPAPIPHLTKHSAAPAAAASRSEPVALTVVHCRTTPRGPQPPAPSAKASPISNGRTTLERRYGRASEGRDRRGSWRAVLPWQVMAERGRAWRAGARCCLPL